MSGVGFDIIKSQQLMAIGTVAFIFICGAACIGILMLRDKIRNKIKKGRK